MRQPRPVADGPVLVLHADGASRGNPGPAGAGALLTSAAGERIEEISEFLGHATNNEAEYHGLLLGLAAALRRRPARLTIYLDSELVVRQLRGEYRVRSPHLAPLHRQARQLISELADCRIEHVCRAENAAADRLANQAVDAGLARQRAAARGGRSC